MISKEQQESMVIYISYDDSRITFSFYEKTHLNNLLRSHIVYELKMQDLMN